jgi:uncharacterized protein YkwD
MTLALPFKLSVATVVALTLGLLALMAAGSQVTRSQAAGCANAKAAPNEASPKEFRKAIVCLIQRARARRDIPRQSPRQGLQTVAQKHSDVMVQKDCFQHTCPGEASLRKRLVRSGYLKGAEAYAFSEIIGYESTPRQMVERWLAHRAHRKRMLDSRLPHIGAGAAKGAPVEGTPDSEFVTYTVIFGAVKK